MNPPTTELEIDDINGDDEDCSNTDETNNEQEIRGRRHMPPKQGLEFHTYCDRDLDL
jgi:hypothetical protein